MKPLGKVVSILNADYLLISLDAIDNELRTLTVFGVIKDERLKESISHDYIFYPKGEIRIVCDQGAGIYLAKRFQEIQEIRKKVTVPPAFMRGIVGVAAQFQSEIKEVVENIAGPWSVELDTENNLKVLLDTIVKISDTVGVE